MLSKEDIMKVKGRGFLLNRGTECFSGRVVSVAGVYDAATLRAIAECADKFGDGKAIFTSRLSAEIPGIPFEKIEAAEAFMKERGCAFGGTGAKVRPITACKGTTCVYGNLDTQKLAKELHERFYIGMSDVALPHKFKIGVGGCPNSCMKPSLNDVGIEGRRRFTFDAEKCRGCKKCAIESACPSKAVTVKDGKAVQDSEKCLSCGVCLGKCPFGAFPESGEPVCRVYVGGTWGKTTRMGTPLGRFVPEAQVGDIVEKIMFWYKENGLPKERLGKTIDRLGLETLERA
ncbi:MAG: 4Fe-4S dicluster domain-containing protein, partial [Clostridia bacterium]|nr:4Fe-4S dicluster domain-containing protein [Clostridia bacterium]